MLSRRKFAGLLGSAATALLPDGSLRADESAPGSGKKPEGLSDADWHELQARFANLVRVYGKRLSPQEKIHAWRILTTNQHMLASIRTFVVENGDPSACTLRIYEPE